MAVLANIDVPDLEAAIAFYRDGLGLSPGRRLFDGTVAEMLGAGSTIYLLAKPPGSAAGSAVSTPRDYRRHWTPVHLDFVVVDVENAVRRACTAGATLEGPIQTSAWGRLATMGDPFGHGFCLVQFAGRGYDEAA